MKGEKEASLGQCVPPKDIRNICLHCIDVRFRASNVDATLLADKHILFRFCQCPKNGLFSTFFFSSFF